MHHFVTPGKLILAAFLGFAACHHSMAAAERNPFTTDVFVKGTNGYHSYRIPALIVAKNGTLLAFSEGRKNSLSDHGDVDLVLRRSHDNGGTWQQLQLVYEEGDTTKITIGNPCPVLDRRTGRIWLPFCRDNNDILMTFSDDAGQTWAKPRVITESVKKPAWGWYATGPGVGIQLAGGPHAGRLAIPCDHRERLGGKWVMLSHVFYSDDHGRSWQLGGSVARHTDECQIVEMAGGTLMINMRNYWGRTGKRPERDKMRAVAVSRDGGATWGPLRFDKTLVEPICQASFLRYSTSANGGRNRLLFANPASPKTRQRLTIRLSYDEGRRWPVARVLHRGPSAYSSLAVLPDGTVGCLYEGGKRDAYEKILFTRCSLRWLTRGKDASSSRP